VATRSRDRVDARPSLGNLSLSCAILSPENPERPLTTEITMNSNSNATKDLARGFWLVFAALAISTAMAADPPAHIRGTIVSATPETLTVKTNEGNVSVALDSSTRISGIVPSRADQIKAGTFVGIANVPGAAGASALEVVVFPEAMKGTGLGDYPWDLAPQGSQTAQRSAMTNGTVKSSTAGAIATTSAMTNGTVKNTSNASGLVLTVDYGKGEKTIQVPANAPVVGIVPADRSKLLPGAHVVVSTKKDAPKTAASVAVGIDGTVPPM
jgi:hypothetical protein